MTGEPERNWELALQINSHAMVATSDVGKVAAEVLQEQWQGHRILELEGPRRVSPNDIAASLARLLNRMGTSE